jgi:hypothetical protein
MGASSPHFSRALHLVLESARSNGALELNAHSCIERKIATCINVAAGHQDNVSHIGRNF